MSEHDLSGLVIEGLRASGRGPGTLDLVVRPGEVVALLEFPWIAESGVARVLAGFASRSRGRVAASGDRIHGRPPHVRPLGLVSPAWALPPGFRLREAVAHPMRLRGAKPDAAQGAAQLALERLGLGARAEERVGRLAPLERALAELARAIAGDPPVLVLEDPGARLAGPDRQALQGTLHAMLGSTRAAVLLTGREPPLGLARRIVVVEGGRAVQDGSASTLLDRPASGAVARAFGPTNLVPAELGSIDAEGIASLRHASGVLLEATAAEGLAPGARVLLALRPDRVALAPGDAASFGPRAHDARVTGLRDEGARFAVELDLGTEQAPLKLLAWRPGTAHWLQPGNRVAVAWEPERATALPA